MALSPRSLPVRATPASKPHTTPTRNGPRARDFFRRAATDAQNPPAPAAMAVTSSTATISSQPTSRSKH